MAAFSAAALSVTYTHISTLHRLKLLVRDRISWILHPPPHCCCLLMLSQRTPARQIVYMNPTCKLQTASCVHTVMLAAMTCFSIYVLMCTGLCGMVEIVHVKGNRGKTTWKSINELRPYICLDYISCNSRIICLQR